MAAKKKTLYEILGVARDANSIDLGLAHQQRFAELQQAAPHDPSAMALLHQAYEILSNSERRATYDASIVTADEKAAAAEQAQSPDFVVEADAADAPPPQRRWIAFAAGAVALAALLFFAFQSGRTSAPPAPTPGDAPVAAPSPAPPPAPLPPKPRSAAEILKEALPSVGQVQSIEMSGRQVTVGLASAIEPGAMLTTCHGLPTGAQLVVRVGREVHSASVALADEHLDLCKLSVAGLGGRVLTVAPDDPRLGDKIYALGANAAGGFAITEGTVKQLRTVAGAKVVEVSMPITPTASGGAIFDTYGRLAAIATTPHRYGQGLNIALPAAWIAQLRSRAAARAP